MELLKLMARNALRHKLRSLLTAVGIAVAVLAFMLLRTVVTAWHAGVERSAANRLITRHAVSFVFPLPYAYRDRIARVPGVEKVTYSVWFSGVYIDKNQFFARMAVDADTFFDVYPEFLVPADQLAAFKRERNACIIGAEIAERYHLKIGDVMPLEGDIFPGRWEFVVRGIYEPRDKATDPTSMLFQWQYLEQQARKEKSDREGQVGWYVTRIDSPDNAAPISEAIDALFANSRAETKTETERAFHQNFLSSMGSVMTAMDVMSFVIIGIILLVLANTMIMSARERTHEYAVLKTLGFTGGHILALVAGESLCLSILGTAAGMAATVPAVAGFKNALPKGWFPVFYIEPKTVFFAVLAGLAIGLVAALIPARRATSQKIVEGLRYIG